MKPDVNVVAIGQKFEPLTDQSKIVALIEFTDEKLVVKAADQATAQSIMAVVTVPVWGGETVHFGEDGTLFRRVKRHPGTSKHFRALGETNDGRAVLEAIGYVVLPPWSTLIQVPLPTFSAQVIYQPPASEN